MERIYARKPLPYRQKEAFSIIHLGERRVLLNESGAKIWNLVDGRSSASGIASSVTSDINAPQSATKIIAAKVGAFLENLYAQGLLWEVQGRYFKGLSIKEKSPLEDSNPSAQTSNTDLDVEEGTLHSVQEVCMTPEAVVKNPISMEDQIYKLYWDKNYIQKMHVELTYRCNFRCVHCYNSTHGGGSTELTTDEWVRAFDELADMGCWLLTFTGGEVFVRKDILNILQAACDRGFTFRLNTNGSLIDEKMVQQLEPMRPFLQSFDVSFYGAVSDVHDTLARRPGSYNNVMRALHLLKETQMGVVAKFITMRDNFDGIEKFEDDMRQLGVPHVVSTGALIPQTDRNTQPLVQLLTDDQYKKMMSSRKPKGFTSPGNCKPGHIRGAITPDGHISPCEWLTDLKYGNLRENSLREIWYSPQFLAFRKRFEEKNECPTCDVRSSCGRCPAHSYLETGDILHCAPIQRHNAEICQSIGVFDA